MESLIVMARGDAVVDNDSLARAMLTDTLVVARSWRAIQTGVDLNRRVAVIADHRLVDDDVEVVVVGRDVSDRDALAAAVDADFARGARAVAAITARSPTLPSYLLDHAFRALQFEPVVVGPTADAGTWLVGIQRGCAAAPPPLAVPQALASGDDVSALALLPFWYLIPDVVTDAAAWLWHIAGSRRGDAAADATLSVLRRPR